MIYVIWFNAWFGHTITSITTNHRNPWNPIVFLIFLEVFPIWLSRFGQTTGGLHPGAAAPPLQPLRPRLRWPRAAGGAAGDECETVKTEGRGWWRLERRPWVPNKSYIISICVYIYNIVSCYIWCDVLCSYIIVDRWYLWGRLVRYGHSMKL